MKAYLKQYRRFIRRSPLTAWLACLVLAAGFAGSVLAYTVMTALSSSGTAGMRTMTYATIAELTGGGGSQSISWKAFQELRGTAKWSDPKLLAYAESIRAKLRYHETERVVSVAAASRGFFTDFTKRLEVGQDFSSSSESNPSIKEVILSNAMAERFFSVPGNALDRNIILNGQNFRVIGVAPKNFSGLWSATDIWISPSSMVALSFGQMPEQVHPVGNESSSDSWQKFPVFYVLAGSERLLSQQLQSKLASLLRLPADSSLSLHVTEGLSKDPIWDAKIRSWARLTLTLSIAIILASGLNYCGLLLTQIPLYVQEVRLKRVLGARLGRIAVESMSGPVSTVLLGFLIAASGVIGALQIFERAGSGLLQSRIPWQISFRLLGVELAVAFVVAICIAIAPAIRLIKDSGTPRLGYTASRGRGMNLTLNLIVGTQIASFLLTCLMAEAIFRVVHSASKLPLGFNANNVAVVELGPALKDAPIEFSTSGDREFPFASFTRRALENSKAKPDIQSIAASSCAPLTQGMKTISIQRMDRELPARSIHFCAVSQTFFQVLGNPIVKGSGFSGNRFTGDVSEVVINEKLANELWQGEDPLHCIVRVAEPAWGLEFNAEIVGVAQDMRFFGFSQTPDATVFLPLQGNAFTLSLPLYFLSKGTESPRSIADLVSIEAASSMPSLAVDSSYEINESLHRSFMEQNARVIFSISGTILVGIIACAGLYGVLVHSVNSKRREMAIRACFGALARDLRKIILRQVVGCFALAIGISLLAWRPLTLLWSSSWHGTVNLTWEEAIVTILLCLGIVSGVALKPATVATKVSLSEMLKTE